MCTPVLIRFLFLVGILQQTTTHDSCPYYFYTALSYGTQANYNPFNVIINGGYGILQIEGYDDELGHRMLDYPYSQWFENVWQTIGHPLRTINEFGWKRFITTEVFPTTVRMQRNQWVPNYFLHLVGAGMHYRATEEWFRYHGFSHARVWSVATMAVYHVFSEVVENRGSTALTVDHIADLYIFDPAGILLFTNDGVCRFFSQKLHLAEWSMQPAYNLATENCENMGQFYVVKYPIARTWSLTVHMGMHGMAGFSHHISDGQSLTLTAGFLVEDLVPAEQEGEGQALSAVLTWRAGLFYDRNNSLLASLMVSTVPQNRIRLNVYPGIIRCGHFSPGLFLSGSKEWVVGINIGYLPIGVAWGK